MKIQPHDSLKATYWGLLLIWGCGGIGLLLITGKAIFAIMYLVALGPIMTLIYHTTKAELHNQLSSKKKDLEDVTKPVETSSDSDDAKPR